MLFNVIIMIINNDDYLIQGVQMVTSNLSMVILTMREQSKFVLKTYGGRYQMLAGHRQMLKLYAMSLDTWMEVMPN